MTESLRYLLCYRRHYLTAQRKGPMVFSSTPATITESYCALDNFKMRQALRPNYLANGLNFDNCVAMKCEDLPGDAPSETFKSIL